MKILIYSVLYLVLFTCNNALNAQQLMFPLGNIYKQNIDFEINKQTNINSNTGFKPFTISELNSIINIDSSVYKSNEKEKFFKTHKKNWIWKKLLFDDFISIEKERFNLYINPLFFLEYGKITETGQSYFINTRAVEIKGNIGKNLSFYSSFRENQAEFRPYIYNWAWNRLVVPGQGALKKNNNNITQYDFSSASGYLSFTPINNLNIQIGQDKQFIGEGHRSLLLSDNSSNYPFAKFSYTLKSLKYTTVFAEFRDFETAYYQYHFKKHAAFNYLSYNYKNRFEIGIFEGGIYQTTDTAEYYNKFQADYFIPIIGVRTITNGFSSNNNILLGFNSKLKITKFIITYGQIAVDDFKENQFAYQAGIKIFDIFHEKIKGHRLYGQTEFNTATPHTYSHPEIKYQTWSHYNQELAHPAGSDFQEIYIITNYSYKSVLIDFRLSSLTLNNKSSFSDIYHDVYNFSSLSAIPKTISHKTLTAAYIINPKTHVQIYAGLDIRTEKQTDTQTTDTFIMFGLKTGLNNFYYDF